MKTTPTSRVLAGIIAGITLTSGLAIPAHAQMVPSTPQTAPQTCTPITNNIGYGANDYAMAGENGEVTALQNFLVSQGVFANASVGTGHFGPLTLRAVESFQAAHGISATGFVGPLTRAEIALLENCGTSGTLSISSLSPTSAKVGDTLTIYGTGFTSANTVLFGNLVAVRNVSANSSTSLTITIPSSLSPNCTGDVMCPMFMMLLSPNTYNVSVVTASGTSNALPLTITAGGTATMIPN